MNLRSSAVLALLLAACGDGATDPGVPGLAAIAAGGQSACALTEVGQALCWGDNTYGQLGTAAGDRQLVPAPIDGGPRFVSIDPGITACAIDREGRAFCWGASGGGNIGNGSASGPPCGTTTIGCYTRPQGVITDQRFRQVVNAGEVTCGIAASSSAWCWGPARAIGIGAVPDGDARLTLCGVLTFCAATPVEVPGGRAFVTLAEGNYGVCGTTRESRLFCWGSDLREIEGAPSFTQLAGYAGLTCGVTAEGQAYCWGEGDQFFSPDPVPIGQGTIFSSVTTGESHACGVTPGGTAYCWGSNRSGQLGNGTTESAIDESGAMVPKFVSGGLRFRAVAAGADFTCGVTFDGDGYCWGANDRGQLGDGTLTRRLVPTPVVRIR